MASDSLKIAKALANLENLLAGMTNRQELLQVAGMEDISAMVDRVYEYAERLKAGGVTDLRPAYAEYTGWDPQRILEAEIEKKSKPFIDTAKPPVQPELENEEKYRFPREQTSSPHAADVQMDAEASIDKSNA